MKRSTLGFFLAGMSLVLVAAEGCGKATQDPMLGGETHWFLQRCGGSSKPGNDPPCGPGLECVCGACTVACTDDASCQGVGPSARCATVGVNFDTSRCDDGPPERMCVPPDADAPLEGRPYDVRGCFGPLTTAGFPELGGGVDCMPRNVYASDEQGTCWLFSSSCVPVDFSVIGGLEALGQACSTATDICSDAPSCSSDLLTTVIGCLSCTDGREALLERVNETADRYNLCSTDADCFLARGTTTCDTACPLPINRNLTDGFNRDMARLERGFCSTGSNWAERCGTSGPDCATDAPVCRDGRCAIGP
jgi:hypothetical protein